MAHGTSFSSITVAWKAIPGDHVNGILRGYVVKVDGIDEEFYGCPSKLTMAIQELEKSKVYKVQVAGYTSKGHGNFSEYLTVVTNIDGKSLIGHFTVALFDYNHHIHFIFLSLL